MCLMPFIFINKSNSCDTNCGPLSDTNCSGRPYAENNRLNSSMVLVAVVLDISIISGHLEWASTASKYIRFRNGPAKSTCILLQGFKGHNHGCSGAGGAVFRTDWQSTHALINDSISESSPGHHTWLRALLFIRIIPGWAVCSSSSTLFCSLSGIITRIPHSRHPPSIVIS